MSLILSDSFVEQVKDEKLTGINLPRILLKKMAVNIEVVMVAFWLFFLQLHPNWAPGLYE